MGNYCQKEDTPLSEKPTPRTSVKGHNVYKTLLAINRKFLESCNIEYISNFHKKIVEADIRELSQNMRQKQLEVIIRGKYPTEEEQNLIYKGFVEDLKQNEKHLYNQLLLHYNQFIIEFFDLSDEPALKTITSYNQGNVRTSTQLVKNQAIKRSISENQRQPQPSKATNSQVQSIQNQNIMRQFYENKQLAELVLEQIACIFQLCSNIIEYLYGNYILSIFGSDIDSYLDRQILVSRIYQKDVLSVNNQIQMIISNALISSFENKSALIKSEYLSPPILNPVLMPKITDSIMSDMSGGELQDSIEKNLYFEGSPHHLHSPNLPYSQTFLTIEKIVNCKMPWLKFKLIGKLDHQIVDIFLKQRSQSQIPYLNDVIKPEDAKIEVLVYILQKYMCSNPNNNLLLCYYELRWMLDCSAVIPDKLKSITCPYFSRFLSIYEMAYNGYLRKQAMRQLIG